MISVDSGALLIIGSFTKQVSDPDFKVSNSSKSSIRADILVTILCIYYWADVLYCGISSSPFHLGEKKSRIRKENAIHVNT